MVVHELGAFSVSLNVKDIVASKAFYEKVGFRQVGGVLSENWVILRNGDAKIGLFQDMLDQNLLYFTPGWDKNMESPDGFTDIRDIQKRFKEEGLEFVYEIEAESPGPAHFMIVDPDGNKILFDQHV